MYTTPQSIAGPALIDSEINADADVSQQISLLDQLGSAVSTGSMLLLPVGGAIVYLRPLYVSSSHNPYPQLRYVVVVYGNQVAMATPSQLAKALSEVTRQAVTGVGVNQRGQPTGPQAAQVRVLLASAATAERQAAAALAAGNLGLYQDDETKVAELIAEAQKVLSEIPSHSSGQPAGTTGGTGAKSAA